MTDLMRVWLSRMGRPIRHMCNPYVSRDRSCRYVSGDHGLLRVRVPPGAGGAVNVSVGAGGQTAATPVAFAYDPPAVVRVNVSFVNAVSGGLFMIVGANFGPGAGGGGATVTIDGTDCERVVVFDDARLVCHAPSRLLVTPNATLSVTVGGQSGRGRVRVACPPAWCVRAARV